MRQSKRTDKQSKPNCYACGKVINTQPHIAGMSKRVFCSRECFRAKYLKLKT